VASHPVQLGISIIPDTNSLDRSRELVRVADEGGPTIVFWPVDPSPEQVERLVAEVLPQLANLSSDQGDNRNV
jgi:hypothetical protein